MNTYRSLCTGIVTLMLMTSVSQAAILASEDFEAGNSMQIKENNNGSVTRIIDPTTGDNSVIYLENLTNGTPSNGTASLYANQWFAETPLVTMSFDIYFNDSFGNVADNPDTHNDGIFVRFGTERADGYQNGPPANPAVYISDFQSVTNTGQQRGFTAGRWYHVDLIAQTDAGSVISYTLPGNSTRDLELDEVHIYIDGKYIKDSTAVNSGNTNGIASVSIETLNGNGTGNRADFYVDNIVVRDDIYLGSVPASAGYRTSNMAPSENLIEYHQASTNDPSSFGPSRITDDSPSNPQNRVIGQTFTISGAQTNLLDALTLRIAGAKTFDDSIHNLAVALLKDTDDDGKGDLQIGSTYTYDVSDRSFSGDMYLTLPLGDGISNVVAGIYQLETYYAETNASNTGLNWERSLTGNEYTNGGSVTKIPNDGTFPVGGAIANPNGQIDFTFYLQGRDMADVLPTFGTFSLNASAPVDDLLESYQAISNLSSFSSTRVTDSPTINSDNRVLGQSFELAGITGAATINAITMQKTATVGNLSYTNASHTYQLALMKDTNSDGKGDLLMGDTYNFDFTGETFNSNETYISFNLGAGITGVVDGVYHVEFYWGEVDPLHTGFPMARSSDGNGYANGGQIAKYKNEGTFPVGAGMGAPSATADFTFFIQGTVDAPADYESWADGYGLVGADRDLDADLEPDGMDNLTEYALGGDPNVGDAAIFLPTYSSESAYIEYVHRERSDAAARGLDYTVQSTAMLTAPAWASDATITYVGKGAIDGDFDSVTNRLDTASGTEYFIRLRIQQD